MRGIGTPRFLLDATTGRRTIEPFRNRPMRSHIENVLRDRLQASHVEVVDDSHKHAGHAGAIPGKSTHFTAIVVCEAFVGKSPIERHRMVNQLFAEELRSGTIHALALTTRTPAEWTRAG